MADDISKYRTFLKRTHRQVRRTANDHDKAQIGAGQTALLDRIDELKALKKCVTNAIRSRVDILEGEERELRKLSKQKEKIAYVEADVFIDSRQGGVIVVLDAETGEVLKGPMPLSSSQREVFASTKSQPGLFGDPVAVNEELARKLALTDFLAEDAPITLDERVRNALDAGDIPEETKRAILALEEENDDDPAPKAKKEKAPKEPKKKGKKKGAFTDPQPSAPPAPKATPDPITPPTAGDDEPGPAAIEPDREELPKHPPRARTPLSDTPPEEDEPSAGDVADAEGMAESEPDETAAPDATDEPTEPAVDAEEETDEIPDFETREAVEPTAETTDGEPAEGTSEPDAFDADIDEGSSEGMGDVDADVTNAPPPDVYIIDGEDAAPVSSDAPGERVDDVDASEQPEPTDVPPDAEIETDPIPEMGEAPTDPAPAMDAPEAAAGEPVNAAPEVVTTDTAAPAVEPTKPAEDVATPVPAAPKKRAAAKKKGDVEPPNQDAAPPAPVEPVAPAETTPAAAPEAPALNLASHFGLKNEKMALDAMAAFKSMAKRDVFFSKNLTADVETAAKTKFSAGMKASVVPMFAHLAAEKEITRRKLPNGDFAYYLTTDPPKSAKDLTADKVEAAIAAYLKR